MGLIMRSLTFKLTLAFLLVGLLGAILVAVLVEQRTRAEFERFRLSQDQDRTALVRDLSQYYATLSAWEGVGTYIAADAPLSFPSRGLVLAKADYSVVLGNRNLRAGEVVP